MIFLLTVIIWCGWYIGTMLKKFDSEDAKERPWAYDHTSAMGAGFGLIIHLFFAIIVGAILQAIFG